MKRIREKKETEDSANRREKRRKIEYGRKEEVDVEGRKETKHGRKRI